MRDHEHDDRHEAESRHFERVQQREREHRRGEPEAMPPAGAEEARRDQKDHRGKQKPQERDVEARPGRDESDTQEHEPDRGDSLGRRECPKHCGETPQAREVGHHEHERVRGLERQDLGEPVRRVQHRWAVVEGKIKVGHVAESHPVDESLEIEGFGENEPTLVRVDCSEQGHVEEHRRGEHRCSDREFRVRGRQSPG